MHIGLSCWRLVDCWVGRLLPNWRYSNNTRVHNGSLDKCSLEYFPHYINNRYIVDGPVFYHMSWSLNLEQIHYLWIGGIN